MDGNICMNDLKSRLHQLEEDRERRREMEEIEERLEKLEEKGTRKRRRETEAWQGRDTTFLDTTLQHALITEKIPQNFSETKFINMTLISKPTTWARYTNVLWSRQARLDCLLRIKLRFVLACILFFHMLCVR